MDEKEEPAPQASSEDLRDVPPLSEEEYKDDEDVQDAAKLHDYHKEYNIWLIFLGTFAFLNVILITKMTYHPTRQQQAMVQQANIIIAAMQRAPNATYIEPIQLPEEEVWVPALWYSSLILTVLNTLVVLLIKHWLMGCSIVLFQPLECETRFLARHRSKSHSRSTNADWDWDAHGDAYVELNEEDRKEWWGEHKERRERYRAARRDALMKTDMIRRGTYVLLFGAVSMFVAGAVGKLWTMSNILAQVSQ